MINMFGSLGRYAQRVRDGCTALHSCLNSPSVQNVEKFLQEKRPLFTAVLGSISAGVVRMEGFSMRSVAWLSATVGSGRLLRSAIPFLRSACQSGIAWLDRAVRVAAVGERAALITQDVIQSEEQNRAAEPNPEPMGLIERVDRTIDSVEQRLCQAERLTPVCRVAKKNLDIVACVFAFMMAVFCQAVSQSGLATGVQGLAAVAVIVALVGRKMPESREEELRVIEQGAPLVD